MKTFEDLGLSSKLCKVLKKNALNIPFELQRDIIPLISRNNNLLIESGPGAGTFITYALPLLDKIVPGLFIGALSFGHLPIIFIPAGPMSSGIPNEEKMWNNGMSACAVCDGALPMFRNQPLMVIGGGDTAVEEASYLTKFGSVVYMVHRRDTLRASKIMQERALKNPKLEILWDSVIDDAIGEDYVTGAKITNLKTKENSDIEVAGIFYAIGHTPNTSIFNGQLDLDESGYIKIKLGTQETSVEGVFAAGDVHDHKYRQAVTAAGTGCAAALEAERWLAEKGLGE